jgi:hypothetical protein
MRAAIDSVARIPTKATDCGFNTTLEDAFHAVAKKAPGLKIDNQLPIIPSREAYEALNQKKP